MGSLELTFVEQKTKLMGKESFGTDWCFRERERCLCGECESFDWEWRMEKSKNPEKKSRFGEKVKLFSAKQKDLGKIYNIN